MSSIMAELRNNSIITSDAVMRLKSYIAGKSPDVSAARRAVILADAMNKVIDSRLPNFEEAIYGKMKRLLLEHAAVKPSFEIHCSDVFQAAIEIKESGEHFFEELDLWLAANLKWKVSREQLIDVVLEAHEFMTLEPEMNILDMIAAAESAIQVRPDMPAQTAAVVIAGATAAEAANAEALAACQATMGVTVEQAAEAVVTAVVAAGAVMTETVDEAAISVPVPVSGMTDPKSASGIDEVLEPYAVLAYITNTFCQKRSSRAFVPNKLPGNWRKASALAAVAVMLAVVLFFRGVKISGKTSLGPGFPEEAVGVSDIAYTMTVLTNEDIAAGSDNAANERKIRMKATAYDLSVESCGKLPGDPGYGITSSGRKAEAGRTVAVDPAVIPLGSRLKITFPEEYSRLDGIYVAEDTGRLIKGSSIDIFFGEDDIDSTAINEEAMDFGVRFVEVTILDNAEKSSS